MSPTRFKLVFFTPLSHLGKVRASIFATGAGTIGGYTGCCFTSTGKGRFKPGPSSNPSIGQPNRATEVEETRCEIVCIGIEQTRAAVRAMKTSHPYEEVAYDVYRLEDL